MEWKQKLVLDIKLGHVPQKQEFGSRSKTSDWTRSRMEKLRLDQSRRLEQMINSTPGGHYYSSKSWRKPLTRAMKESTRATSLYLSGTCCSSRLRSQAESVWELSVTSWRSEIWWFSLRFCVSLHLSQISDLEGCNVSYGSSFFSSYLYLSQNKIEQPQKGHSVVWHTFLFSLRIWH